MLNDNNYVHGDQNVQVPAHLNYGKYILSNLRKFKDNVAIINSTTDQKVTYKELAQNSVDLAVSLVELGIGLGDTVALCMEPRNEFIQTILAVIYTGATYTPIEFDCGPSVLRHKFNVTKPKHVICSGEFWNKHKSTLKSFELKTLVTLDDGPDLAIQVSTLLNRNINVDLFEPAAVKGQSDVAFVLFSSGTTGMPKGVMLTHENTILNSLPHDDESLKVAFVNGSWYHNYDIFMSFKFLALGRTLVYWDGEGVLPILEAIEHYKINIAMLVPITIFQLATLSNVPRTYMTDSLKIIYSRSAPLHYRTIELVKERFPKLEKVLKGYGMTEAGEPTSENWNMKGYKVGSIGMPAPGVTIKVVDVKTRSVVGANQLGEICIRGPVLMKGYIDVDPLSYLDEQGFFKTGDMGYYDNDSYFFIVDRIKEIIPYCDFKVAPLELETILQLHPGVKEAGVVGKPDPECGELPTAFVVRKKQYDVTEQELKDHVASEATSYMQLRGGVIFVNEIPRNPRKKILRNRLREMLREIQI